MADAAHLTSAILEENPSIFEVLAQESLISTIRPAIKHAVRVSFYDTARDSSPINNLNWHFKYPINTKFQ